MVRIYDNFLTCDLFPKLPPKSPLSLIGKTRGESGKYGQNWAKSVVNPMIKSLRRIYFITVLVAWEDVLSFYGA